MKDYIPEIYIIVKEHGGRGAVSVEYVAFGFNRASIDREVEELEKKAGPYESYSVEPVAHLNDVNS